MLANLQNYLEIKHDCLLIYVNRIIRGAEVPDPSAPLFEAQDDATKWWHCCGT